MTESDYILAANLTALRCAIDSVRRVKSLPEAKAIEEQLWQLAQRLESQVDDIRQSRQSQAEAANLVCRTTAFKAGSYPRHVEVQTADWDAAVVVAKDWLAQQGLPIPERD